ncbi:solute carrier family 40 member 1 [Latimeria chalumnae]|uniref:solute carrier family 40 member 1 n=1 Tax=Latimeria chalumnae TaxID=7897 RepID=UPI00313C275A
MEDRDSKVTEFESTEGSNTPERQRKVLESALNYLQGPRFLIYVSGALSMWGDRMWHFAISVFLIELYGKNLLLTAIFGLVVAGSVLAFGALIGDWVDRNPRNKAAHASLFIQNSSVTVCSIVLMLIFSYKHWIEQMWDGWLTVAFYTGVIILADVANLASTALTITIQRDWIVVITGDNRGQLAGMNATVRRIDQVINILAPLAVGQVMTLASNVVGCGFILGWNLVSLLVEFLFLSRVYEIVPELAVKSSSEQYEEHHHYLERQMEMISMQVQLEHMREQRGQSDVRKHVEELIMDHSVDHMSTNKISFFLGDLPVCTDDIINERQQLDLLVERKCYPKTVLRPTTESPFFFRKIYWILETCKDGWKTYYKQPVFLAGMALAFLYTTVLGFDCITTGYAYTQGISGSFLSVLMGISAISGLMGTVMFTKLRRRYGLVTMGVISSCLHLGCLTLCVLSVFVPGSPFDLSILSLFSSYNSSTNTNSSGQNQLHTYPLGRNIHQPLFPDQSYISVILLFSGVILARIGLWSFDLTVTQLLQENIPESERGVVNGVQSSMNYLMDLLHYIMVILAPLPQHFGLLVIISVFFITAGHAMYFIFYRKDKRKKSQKSNN